MQESKKRKYRPGDPLNDDQVHEDRWSLDPAYPDHWSIQGHYCLIYLTPRPWYCDRGNYLAHLELRCSELVDQLDGSDGWPRYYYDLTRAQLECQAWMSKRGLWPTNAEFAELKARSTQPQELQKKAA